MRFGVTERGFGNGLVGRCAQSGALIAKNPKINATRPQAGVASLRLTTWFLMGSASLAEINQLRCAGDVPGEAATV